LKDSSIDVVYIPVPSGVKKQWCIAAAQHGKHVIAEKPFSSATEVEEITQACRDNNVCFLDGTMFMHNPRTHEVAKLIASGDLGEVTFIHADFRFAMSRDSKDIRVNKELEPLGALGDVGWYTAKGVLVGTQFELPTKVFAHATYLNGVVFSLSAILLFKDGKRASFDCGFESSNIQILAISGVKKTVTLTDYDIPWSMEPLIFPKVAPSSVLTYQIGDTNGVQETVSIDIGTRSQETRLIDEMNALVAQKKADKTFSGSERWMREALATQKILNALAESAEKGTFVEIH